MQARRLYCAQIISLKRIPRLDYKKPPKPQIRFIFQDCVASGRHGSRRRSYHYKRRIPLPLLLLVSSKASSFTHHHHHHQEFPLFPSSPIPSSLRPPSPPSLSSQSVLFLLQWFRSPAKTWNENREFRCGEQRGGVS